ncbi:HNH endonuclease [Methanospirillum sp.]|uniref:HNH endonuclease n=1 Tax=Methanospirillum sp. TaxID=45200 RepID=UPI002CC4BEC0|nr:HNH endonuclease [Methanospirillum sp.]HPP76882.1 HNH endonuclease [Methanospirillum sp.]
MSDLEILIKKIDTLEDMVKVCDETISSLECEKTRIKQWINRHIEGIESQKNRIHGDIITCKRVLDILMDKPREKEWKEAIMLRDNYMCQRCKSTVNLTCHHIIPRSVCKTNEEMWDVHNGIVLCDACHTEWYAKNTDSLYMFIRWLRT